MTRNDKIQVEAEPTLFDGLEPQETAGIWQETTEPKTRERLAERVAAYSKGQALRADVWQVIPSAPLILRGETYYNQREATIADQLKQAGMSESAVNTVLGDYVGALNGVYIFEASPKQMQQALKAIEPLIAFNIDRYGLYLGLLMNYSRFLSRLHDYNVQVKGEDATEKTKRAYIDADLPTAADAMAIKWLLTTGYVEPSDFAGFDPSEMGRFWGRVQELAGLGEYTTYYTIARLALIATPEELADVEAPPSLNTTTPIATFCEQVVQETAEILNRAAEKFGGVVKADTPTEQEQARQAGKSWQEPTNRQTVVLYENYGKVLSKPVNISPSGADIIKAIPIQRYIDEFNAKPVRFGNIDTYPKITEESVIRALDGVGQLPTYQHGRMIVEGRRLVFRTNLSEFSDMCGYSDAGQSTQRALLGSLLLLRDLYVIVDRPYKYYEYKDINGRKRRKQSGGPTAIQFVNISEIGIKSGELIIEAYRESFNSVYRKTPDGKKIPNNTFIDLNDYNKLRRKAKGTSQYRFNIQIATKTHKSERQLIYEIFGLEEMIKNAETVEEQKKVKTYIQNHYADFRKKVLGWFNEYLSDGIITEFNREPSKTDKKDFVLSWKCPDPQELIPPQLVPTEQEPDEQ